LIIATRTFSCHRQFLRQLLLIISLSFSFVVQVVAETSVNAEPVAQQNLLLVGDSISAAYGMSLREGWANLLQQRLDSQGTHWQVVNASISGETSAGAAHRLPALLEQHAPGIVIIELGGNDGLRGYPIKQLRANLQQMIQQSQAMGAQVILVGMEIPPNYGARYTQMFRDAFVRVAEQESVALVPFLLDGVAVKPELMQKDGIHPTVEAQPLLLDNIWPTLEPLLTVALEL
jgi:acyl-CoA thioesterase I